MHQTTLERIEQELKKIKRQLQCGTQFFETVEEFPAVGVPCAIYVDKSTGAFYVYDTETATYITADAGEDIDFSLTTTGTSGPATLVGTILNIPQYQGVLTFDNTPTNGSTNPVTSDGVFDALALKQNNVTLTTTGTSGAATFVGSTLNIPQYQGVLTNPVTGTGTSGQVAYWNGTTTQTGSNNLFWDAANQRLDIIGKDALNATNSLIIKDNASRNTFYVKNDGEVGNAVTGATQLQWRFGTAATSPGLLLIRQSTTTILSSGNSGNAAVGTESNQPFGILSNNTARIFVEAAGNVGIGLTSSISARLHVRGSGTTSATTALLVENSNQSEYFRIYDDGQIYINGRTVPSPNYTTLIRIGTGLSNSPAMWFIGNSNIYINSSNTTENIPSALFAMGGTTKGFLPPRMTTTQRDAIASPAAGLIIFNTTTTKLECYDGAAWQAAW